MLKRWQWGLLGFVLVASAAIPAYLIFWKQHIRGTEDSERQDESELPSGWNIKEIGDVVPPLDKTKTTYILACKSIVNKQVPRSLTEECLVLTHWQNHPGSDGWVLAVVSRRPKSEDNDEDWYLPTGFSYYPCEKVFDKRPTNKDIYRYMDNRNSGCGWSLSAEIEGYSLVNAMVCNRTWKAVIKEQPTRSFSKDLPPK